MSTYTDEERAEAVACYQEHGTAETSRRLSIPRRTIIDWASKAGVIARAEDKNLTEARELRQSTKRQEIREMLLDRVNDFLERMEDPANTGDVKNLATAVGILIDKYRLEMGEATARTYIEGHDDIDRRYRQLVEELKSNDQARAGS